MADKPKIISDGFSSSDPFWNDASQIALNPISIRGLFLLLTRLHYSSADNYGNAPAVMRNFIWSKDPKVSTLFIDLDYIYDPKALDKRPAIFVGTSDYEFQKKVINNSVKMSEDRAAEAFGKIASTNVIIRHIDKTADSALQLADMTSQFFFGIQKLMQERLGLYEYQVMSLKTSRPFEHSSIQVDQQFMADLIINMQYNCQWLIFREGHRLKTWGFEACVKETATGPSNAVNLSVVDT